MKKKRKKERTVGRLREIRKGKKTSKQAYKKGKIKKKKNKDKEETTVRFSEIDRIERKKERKKKRKKERKKARKEEKKKEKEINKERKKER